jgi:hypothetical protein
VHPRNKKTKVYDASKVRSLDAQQLNHLFRKIKTIDDNRGFEEKDKDHWCKIAVDSTNNKSSPKPQTAASYKSRGIQLDKKYRYGLFKVQPEKPKANIEWEKTHIILAKNNRFPPSSEHEVSHLCHNPKCCKESHLIWELHSENLDREKCRYTRDIECPKCSHHFTACKHDPKCL